jgi:hypothetical protein
MRAAMYTLDANIFVRAHRILTQLAHPPAASASESPARPNTEISESHSEVVMREVLKDPNFCRFLDRRTHRRR